MSWFFLDPFRGVPAFRVGAARFAFCVSVQIPRCYCPFFYGFSVVRGGGGGGGLRGRAGPFFVHNVWDIIGDYF